MQYRPVQGHSMSSLTRTYVRDEVGSGSLAVEMSKKRAASRDSHDHDHHLGSHFA
jgi:hypothetical protein